MTRDLHSYLLKGDIKIKIIIYGMPMCSACDTAKSLCESKGISYDYATIGIDITFDQLQERTGRIVRSAPQIFIMADGFAEYVGGLKELQERLE